MMNFRLYATIFPLCTCIIIMLGIQKSSYDWTLAFLVDHLSQYFSIGSETTLRKKIPAVTDNQTTKSVRNRNQIIDIPRGLGINISRVIDYATQWMFVDMMKQARPWITQDAVPWYAGKPWDTELSNSMPVDSDGYPLVIPFLVSDNTTPQQVVTIVGNESYPAGEYQFMADGDGDVSFDGKGVSFIKNDKFNITNRDISYSVKLENGHNYIIITINRSNPNNHLRNFSFVKQDFLTNYKSKPFHPDFLSHLEGFKVLRYMDYLLTNNNPTTTELNIPSTYYTQAVSRGGSIDYISELSNQSKTDPWINIPHNASDSYIKDVALRLYKRLDKNRRIYIEFSNELWNSSFKQSDWLYKKACSLPETFVPYEGKGMDWGVIACDDLASAIRYQGLRNVQIYQIFESVFGKDFTTRIIKVISGQAANADISKKLLAIFEDASLNPSGYKPDALAIAPYFGIPVANNINKASQIESIQVEEILDMASKDMEVNSFNWMQRNKSITHDHKISLIAYEGGQHLVGSGGLENNNTLTQKLINANRNPLIRGLYEKYLNTWFYTIEGDLFVLFNNIEPASKWGSWGLYEYQNQATHESPKAQATMNIINNLN